MKRYFKTITAVVLAVLAVAACQKENLGEVAPDGREAEVKLTLTSPQIGTKSYADGQTVNKVFVHVYQQDADGNLKYIAPATAGESATPSQVVNMTGGAAKYSTRLVTGQKYTFVFWAECLGTATSPYTYDPENKTVTVSYTGMAGNDETRDAFCNVLKDVEITGAYSSDVKLYRPFAQLNFGVTNEDYAAAKAAGLEVTAAKVKLTNAATSLNLLDGSVLGAKDVIFDAAALPTETLSAAGATYKYVAMDYVLVGKSAKTLSEVTLTLTATGAQSATPEFTYSNVPLQANYRTNIVGNLFTSPAEVQIEITPGFETPDNDVVVENVSSIAAANEAFANGATAVNVTSVSSEEDTNIVLPKTTNGVSLTLPAVPAGKTVTIKYADGASEGQKPQTLTVNAASADAITIEAPTTHVELNGVTVNTVTASTSSTTLVVGKDVKITTLNIEQGAAEIYGNVSKVVKGKNAGVVTWYVDDAANFETALNNADKVVLTADIDLKSGVAVSHSAELNLNKHSIANIVDIWKNSNAVVNVDNCTLSISGNGSVKAKAEDCYTFNVKNGGKLVINGGDFVGNVSVIQVDEGVAEVYGGNFSLAQTWPGTGPCGCDYMINMIDANYKAGKAKAVVKGGTFVGFNPGDCVAEGAHTDFVAEGYASVTASANPLTYKVVPVENPGEDGEALEVKLKNTSGKVYEIASELSINTSVGSKKNNTLYISKTGGVIPSESFRKDVSESFIVTAGTLTFDGQGTIQGPSGSTYGNGSQAIFVQGGKINIYGNLTIDGGSGSEGNHAVTLTSGTANIYGGYFHAGLDKNNKSSEVIYMRPAWQKYTYCNIYGGVFETEGDPAYLLNIKNSDRARATFKVYGGTFVGFNPADNIADGEHTNFVAEGYKSVETTYNGKQAWEVVPE